MNGKQERRAGEAGCLDNLKCACLKDFSSSTEAMAKPLDGVERAEAECLVSQGHCLPPFLPSFPLELDQWADPCSLEEFSADCKLWDRNQKSHNFCTHINFCIYRVLWKILQEELLPK